MWKKRRRKNAARAVKRCLLYQTPRSGNCTTRRNNTKIGPILEFRIKSAGTAAATVVRIEISYMDIQNETVSDLLGDGEVALTAGEHQIMGSVRFHFPRQSLEDGFCPDSADSGDYCHQLLWVHLPAVTKPTVVLGVNPVRLRIASRGASSWAAASCSRGLLETLPPDLVFASCLPHVCWRFR